VAQDKIDPEKIVEQNDRPTQEDAQRNARAFADALRSMESILSPSFGMHAGGVMSKGEFGPQGGESIEQFDAQPVPREDSDFSAEAVEAMAQPIDIWSGRSSESIGREPFEFVAVSRTDRQPVAEQPAAEQFRFEQPARNEADAGEPREVTAQATQVVAQPIDVGGDRDSVSFGREPFEFTAEPRQGRQPVAEQPRFEQPVRNEADAGEPREAAAQATQVVAQPIDVWSGRDSESIGREPFEFATTRQQDRPPVAEQPRFEQPVRNEADAGEPPPSPPTETINLPEPQVPQQQPSQPASAVMSASEKPTAPQSLEKPNDANAPRVESAPGSAKEARQATGGPEFLRRLAMPERPIMDTPESGTKEQNARKWLNDHGRAFPNETDPGANPRDGKFPDENRRAMDFAAVEVVDALDEYGMRQVEFAERIASILRMLGRNLERITRSLDSEGRDYE